MATGIFERARTGRDGKARTFWECVIELPKDPTTGKRRQQSRTFPTHKAAKAALTAMRADLANGTSVQKSRDTMADLMRAWLDAKRCDLRPTTLGSYTHSIERYILPRLGAVQVQQLTAPMLRDFYTGLLTEKRARGGDGARTVQLAHLRIKQALGEAVDLGIVPRNVADLVKPPRVVTREKRVWEPADTRRFLDVARDDPHGPLWTLLAATGMRRGEALGLRWQDVDEREGTLRVSQQVNAVGGAPLIQTRPKTGDSARVVPVDPSVVAALKAHRAAQNARRLQAGPDWEDHGLIFTTGQGRPLNPNNALRTFYALCKRAGLDSISIHGLRHSYATLALTSGEDIKAVSEVLGHANVGVTLAVYHHVGKKQHRAVASAVGAALFGDLSEGSEAAI